MDAKAWATLGVVVGLVAAVWWARRSGKGRFQAAISAAEARGGEAYAEGLRAQLGQSVNVSVPVTLGGQSFGPGELSHDELVRIAAGYDHSADHGPAWAIDDGPAPGVLGATGRHRLDRAIAVSPDHRLDRGVGGSVGGEALTDVEVQAVLEALGRFDSGPFDD